MIDWEWLAQIGSFAGGVSAGIGLIGLYFVYQQWNDARKADQTARDQLTRKEELREQAEHKLALAKLAEEIGHSTDMLLIERSKLWAKALNRFPADIVARSVLASAAIRTTVSTTARIESALVLAKNKGYGDELLRSIKFSLSVLKTVGNEDLQLIKYLQDYDLRFAKLRAEVHEKMAKRELTDAENEMLAFHSVDGLIQTSSVFLSLNDSVLELQKKVKSLSEEIDSFAT